MVKTKFLDYNVFPGSTKYVDLETHLTQQNQDVHCIFSIFHMLYLHRCWPSVFSLCIWLNLLSAFLSFSSFLFGHEQLELV